MSKKIKSKLKSKPAKRQQRRHAEFKIPDRDKWEWYAGTFGNNFDYFRKDYSGILTITFCRNAQGQLNRYVRYDFNKLAEYYNELAALAWKFTEDPNSTATPQTNATRERFERLADAGRSDFDALLSAGRICWHTVKLAVSEKVTEGTFTLVKKGSDGKPSATISPAEFTNYDVDEWSCGSQDFTCSKCGTVAEHDIFARSTFCLPGIETADFEIREALIKFWLAWIRTRAARLDHRGGNVERVMEPSAAVELREVYWDHLRPAKTCFRMGRKHGWADWLAINSDIIDYYREPGSDDKKDKHRKKTKVGHVHYTAQASKPYPEVIHTPIIQAAINAVLRPNLTTHKCGTPAERQAPKDFALDAAWERAKSDRERYPVNSKATLYDYIRRAK